MTESVAGEWPVGRRARILEYGENPMDAIENQLVIEDQSAPDVSTLKESDCVIAVKSASVGWVDLIMSSGQYQHMANPPYTPGLEFSGEILWAGSDAKRKGFKIGDEVMADGFKTGPRSKGDYRQFGGFASYAVAPAEALFHLPEQLTFDQANQFLGSYETAYHCLVARGRLQAGETILIHGASGATGLAAVHLAKILGATVIATGRSEEKLEIVRKEGADHVLCTNEDHGGLDSLRKRVRELTDNRGVELVYDGVGGPISAASLRCVQFGARYLIVGWAATPFVAKGRGQRGSPNANQLPTNLIMMKGLDVLGCPTVISTHRDPTIREERLEQLFTWVRSGQLKPYAGRVYPFTELKDALLAKWTSDWVGGCAVHPV
ncbi:MAG: NADPH:quinone oxidoreductase family protein [Planctomycetota bacterium]|nr:NADPH:quinone oxidoreductase family protein [Planctomycetota bacterium]